MASRGRGRRGSPRGASQASPTFDQPLVISQQAFAEAVEIAVAAITHACATVSKGGSDDLQRLKAPHPPLGKEGEVDVMRGIQDSDVGTKRKEDPSSSNRGKRQKTSASHEFQDQGQDWASSQSGQRLCYFCRQPGHMRRDCPRRQESQGHGTPQSQSSVRRVRVAIQDGQMVCYHCQQPGHVRRDCPQRQGSQGVGTAQSQLVVGQERTRFVPPPPSMGQGNQYQFQGATPAPCTSQTGHIGQSTGRGRAQGLQAESSGQARQMMCYHCRQPGHMRQACPRRQRSHGTETERSD